MNSIPAASRLERRIEAGLPEVFWDSERMVQVLTNLFVNAAQAMEGGGRPVGQRAAHRQLADDRGQGHRRWNTGGGPFAGFRAVFHHQTRGYRARTFDQLRHNRGAHGPA